MKFNILKEVKKLLEGHESSQSTLAYRYLGSKAPLDCTHNCKHYTTDIVDFVGDTLMNLPTCSHLGANYQKCPLR